MDTDLEQRLGIVIGLFVLGCAACAFFYGWRPIVLCAIGLFFLAALLQLFARRMGGD